MSGKIVTGTMIDAYTRGCPPPLTTDHDLGQVIEHKREWVVWHRRVCVCVAECVGVKIQRKKGKKTTQKQLL